jgi:hypothetical protein
MAGRASAESQPRLHDGLYLRLSAGLSYFSDAVESEALPLFGVVSGTIKGAAPTLELAAGYTVARGLVVGGALHLNFILSPITSNGHTDLGNLPEDVNFASTSLVLFGPFVDYYFNPATGWHVQGSITYGVLSLGEGRGSTTDRQYVQEQSGSGGAFMAGVGYDFWVSDGWSAGVLGRLTAGVGSGKDMQDHEWTHHVVIPALLLSATMN